MAKLRVKAAIAEYNSKRKAGEKRMTQTDVAMYVWRDSIMNKRCRQVEFYKLASGELKTIRLKTIQDICQFTGVTASFLIEFE